MLWSRLETLDWMELGRPRSLSGLMNLWEANYQALQQLLPGLDFNQDEARSLSQSDAPLYLQVLERTPYTISLMLTYRFEDQGEVPRLRVRIYKDAGLAQALDAEPSELGEHLNKQWERNLLLGKWLEYCLAHGHGFFVANPASDD